jgi:hypothetical protein
MKYFRDNEFLPAFSALDYVKAEQINYVIYLHPSALDFVVRKAGAKHTDVECIRMTSATRMSTLSSAPPGLCLFLSKKGG